MLGLRAAACLLLGVAGAVAGVPDQSVACGAATPCHVDGGSYLIRVPKNASSAQPAGAIVYFHGHRSSAEASMRFKSLAVAAEELGVALIAPDGLGKSWSFPNSPRRERDELAFMHRVLDDVLERFPIDPNRLMSSGFSIGGTMSWYMACYLGERFAGHAPISGTFWRPVPKECPGPDPFISHVHGTADKIFPLEGRVIRKKYRQGNTLEAIEFFRNRGAAPPAVERYTDGGLDCSASETRLGGQVELCLHAGGHSIKGEWVRRGWLRLAAFKGWAEPEKAANAGG